MTWNRLPEPILTPEDGAEWERGGLYKYCLLRHGDLFHIFYNAKNTDHPNPWIEQTGHATSPDLKSWTRSDLNPVLRVTPGAWDSKFRSDPFVVRYGNRWVLYHFYCACRPWREGDPARNLGNEFRCLTVATSKPV